VGGLGTKEGTSIHLLHLLDNVCSFLEKILGFLYLLIFYLLHHTACLFAPCYGGGSLAGPSFLDQNRIFLEASTTCSACGYSTM